MKPHALVPALFALALFALPAHAAQESPAPRDSALSISFETSLEKLFPAETDLAAKLPAAGSISLARNECESFQLVVRAARDLTAVTVIPGDLTSTAGAPAIPKSNVTVNAVGYIQMIKPFYTPYYIRVPNQPKWPDPLLPVNSADVARGTIEPFWITVYAPPGAAPGDYRGELTVSAQGVPPQKASFTVHVWDFTLPHESHLKTAFWLYGAQILQYHSIKSKDDPAYGAMLAKYDDNMLAHRMSNLEISINRPAPLPAIEPGKPADFAAWDKWMDGWFAKGLTFFAVPISAEDPKDVIILKSRVWAAHLREKGWLDRACVFMYDETYKGEEQRQWVHDGDPSMRNALTEVPSPKYPAVDVWVPQMERGYEAFPDAVKWARENNKVLWMYTSSPQSGPKGTNFYPNTNIDFPATHCRLIPWVCWQDNLDGYLYWCVNRWENDPWKTAETYRNQNGNGSFYYPGKDGPVESLRLDAFRDGMEDYEYFCLLKSRADAARADKSKETLVSQADKALDLWADPKDFMYNVNRNPQLLYDRRSAIAQLIQSLAP
jgi:hypothetical protein